MTQAAAGEMDERVLGRRWTVRLDAAGRGSTEVRLSCSRPACAEQRLPTATAGRAAAIVHIQDHLRTGPGPRAQAFCSCRIENCRTHISPEDPKLRAEVWRCGGAVVLAVVADRAGRWWQVMECCARCAAATPGAKVVAASAPSAAPRPAPAPSASPVGTPRFSDRSTEDGARRVPTPRSTPRQRRAAGKIAQRVIPHDLRPDVLREELVELGNLFRAYQQRAEPDLAVLAGLHERKALAFTTWADVTGDVNLRLEANRAEQAASAARLQNQNRTGTPAGEHADGAPPVARLLTSATQWAHARSVLSHVAGHSPLPGPEARLLVLMVTLRTANTGTGNLVGQDVASLGLADPERLVDDLVGCGWLELPGTAGDLLASRPEGPTPITVPCLVPGVDGASPFTFGRKLRPKLSGWAQKAVSDKKLRKAKAPAATRLLALTLAALTSPAGRLGADGRGMALDALHDQVPVDRDALQGLVDQLTATDWLAEAALTDTHLTGQLTERVLPLTCPSV
ncbi:hypothetical protein ACIP6P_19435 [Streptomyces sp. NPDC088729]|uniref:hypothetical protein n=1 Tax=Streptomyces sp. NPDC088729 TaxID=3365876 RepID=UPI003819D3ED